MINKLLSSLTFDNTITTLILLLSLVIFALTIFIRVFFRSGLLRFLPGIILIVVAILKLLAVLPRFLEKSSLGTLTEIMIFLILAVVNICTALILGLLFPRRKRRRRKREA